MKYSKLGMIAGFIIAFALIFELAAHADEDNQSTKLTFNRPVQVPGQILPAGTYVFVLANSESNQDIVRIFNADGSDLLATIQTFPTERLFETAGTSITLAEGQDEQPATLMTWFYPGRETGHQFVYPKPVETKLAQDTKHTLVEEHGTMVNSDANEGGN
jgi:hypothetical protein